MERGDFRPGFELLAEQFRGPLLHFASRLVGEGDGEDALGSDFVTNEIGNTEGDDARFACACAGQNQQWAGKCFDSLTLGGVKRHGVVRLPASSRW